MTPELLNSYVDVATNSRTLIAWIVFFILLAGSAVTYWILTIWLGREKNPLTKTLIKLSAQIEEMNKRELRAEDDQEKTALIIERLTNLCDNLTACVKELRKQ